MNAKRSLRDDQIHDMNETANAADFLISRLREGRDPSKLADWPNQIMRIDVERCRRAAERYLSKAFPSIVVTGVDESFAP
jgi:predicted Zn-dependent peptidase